MKSYPPCRFSLCRHLACLVHNQYLDLIERLAHKVRCQFDASVSGLQSDVDGLCYFVCSRALTMGQSSWPAGTSAQEKACEEYMDDLLEASDAKHLVFGHHTSMLDAIERLLRKCAS